MNGSDPDFPLFSQEGAGELRLQVKTKKWFGAVSTDSQQSSQQQGLLSLFIKNLSCRRSCGCGFLRRRGKCGNEFGNEKELAEAHFHSVAGEPGFILYEKASRVRA
ncbi:MAG TPA: hypothetical protein VKB66_06390 [Candidatus Acidoferrum sp.]|nr:hypothetical protein [Candidatus Acidoferrum sp.]